MVKHCLGLIWVLPKRLVIFDPEDAIKGYSVVYNHTKNHTQVILNADIK